MPRLQLLDDVVWDGQTIPGERTRVLLQTLAHAGRRGLSDGALVEELWPEERPAHPAKALQVVVSRARRATDPGAIERTATGYRLALDDVDVDVWSVRPEALRLASEGRYAEALPLLERIESPDTDEAVIAALVRAIAAVRGVPAALERYADHRTRLAGSLGIDPSPDLQSLHRSLLARDRPVRTGLRYDPTPLLGRADDLRGVSALLTGARVVTILGPGGLGKTRLAQLLGRTAEQPVVHVVELVGVTAPEDVVGEVGSALGVRDTWAGRKVLTPQQRADVRSRIAQQLDTAPTLLIIDNCEHLVEAVADLVAFLVASVPDLRVLTTSRAPLGIAAEAVYALPQLDPTDGRALFEERARAARPGVLLPEQSVASIVDRLDGLPLAIELAAVKVRAMSVEDVARRLDDRFALLAGGDRSAPDRHRTLLAVIEWSWNLLGDQDQDALRRLSVFPDGFTLDAAESVLGAGAVITVAGLVGQSLLTVQDRSGGVRYRMLETIREFGVRKLRDAGLETEARAAVRSWAVEYADRQAVRLFHPEQVAAVEAVRTEEGNLADVLRDSLADGDAASVVVLASALGGYWSIMGDHPRLVGITEALADVLAPWEAPEHLRDRSRVVLAMILFASSFTGGRAQEPARSALRRIGTDGARSTVRALVTLTLSFDPRGDSPDAPDAPDAPAALLHDADPVVRAMGHLWVNHTLENAGDPRGAVDAGEQALALVDDAHGPWMRAMVHTQLAALYAQTGDVSQAARHAGSAVPILERLGDHDDLVELHSLLALSAASEGRVEEASRLLDRMEGLDRSGRFGAVGSLLSARAQLAMAVGRFEEGLVLARRSVEEVRAVRFPGGARMGQERIMLPWVIFAEASAVAAYARYGEDSSGEDLYAELCAKATLVLVEGRRFIDFPVTGLLLFALGLWGLLRGGLDSSDAIRLLALADRFSYHRYSPPMQWEPAVRDADRIAPGLLASYDVEYGTRRGPELLPEARAVVRRLFG
ncbi:ATP-binding protein [Nocardioides insulae]|uniref:ATP-binding protein n=1 Tax=Nocardioides insulae TaxID=394734 RepID=UPI00040938D4|nr:AAA family ATPase [Nocardioides insulae]